MRQGGAPSGAIPRLAALAVASWLPVLLAPGTLRSVAALAPAADSARAYFLPAHAILVYLQAPVVTASAFALFLSPGLFAALAMGFRGGLARWVLSGLGLSLVLVSAGAVLADAVAGAPLRGRAFLGFVAMLALASMALAHFRYRRGARSRPFDDRRPLVAAAALAVPPLILLVLLAPKFHWENFNGDGIHAFETARLLLVQPLPFWSEVVADFRSFPGATSMLFAYPASWFVRAFGEIEAAVRLPYLLYLSALYAGIVECVRHGLDRASSAVRWMPWAGLAVFTVVMAYSATYNPYAADLAMPGAQDTLMMACFAGFLMWFLAGDRGWTVLFAVLTIVSLPNGTLLVALWLMAVAVVWRPIPWQRVLVTGAAVVACLVTLAIVPRVVAAWGLGVPVPGAEYSGHALLGRLRFLQWADWNRLAYLVVPCGVVPALALAAWRRQDAVARALTLVTVAYFGLFYVQAFVALHHFVPVMVLPLAVVWRMQAARTTPWLRTAAVVGAALAMVLSLPSDFTPDSSGRQVGESVEDRTAGYEAVEPAALRRADVLLAAFPYDWDPAVPHEGYGGSPHVWHHYARRTPAKARDVNYLMQPPADAPPEGMRMLAAEPDVVLYLRSSDTWRRHGALRPPTPAGSRLYSIPREVLFRRETARSGRGVIDVKRVLFGAGDPGTEEIAGLSSEVNPSFRPDGQAIVLQSNRDGDDELYVLELQSGTTRQVTSHPGHDGSPGWSPDGRWIAFHSDRQGSLDIWIVGADGNGLTRLTHGPGSETAPVWSPDSSWLTYRATHDGEASLEGVGLDGTARVVDTPVRARAVGRLRSPPVRSPDGGSVVFTSSHDGSPDIWIMSASGSPPRNLTGEWRRD